MTYRKPMKILGLLTGNTVESLVDAEARGLGPIEEVFDLPDTQAQVQVTKFPKLEDVPAQMKSMRPNIVYYHGGIVGEQAGIQTKSLRPLSRSLSSTTSPEQFASIFSGNNNHLNLVYLDAADSLDVAEKIHQSGVPYVIAWMPNCPPLSLHSMHFAHTFFALLRRTNITIPEAFAVSMHLTRTFCSRIVHGHPAPPPLPRLLSAEPPSLPHIRTIPAFKPSSATRGKSSTLVENPEIIPGYGQTRLCAPQAEIRMMVAALNDIINPHCMGHLCESLRALLVTEVRELKVQHVTSRISGTAPTLLQSATAVRAKVRTVSGYNFSVVLGALQDILKNGGIVEHALRVMLTADAQAMQIRLPPPGTPLPSIKQSASVADGTWCVEIVVIASTWAVHLLRLMAQDPRNKNLAAAGVAAVSTTTVSFTKADAVRFGAVATGNDPARLARLQAAPVIMAAPPVAPPPPSAAAGVLPTPKVEGQAPRLPSGPVIPPLSAQQQRQQQKAKANTVPVSVVLPQPSALTLPPLAPNTNNNNNVNNGNQPIKKEEKEEQNLWKSDRPELSKCTEEEFIKDLVEFLKTKVGRKIDNPGNFPEIMLNGSKLDVYGLYKHVCMRGGYDVANRIDWKGGVFPAMKNFDSTHKMTAIGNLLKHHYQTLLLEYENANKSDVQKDGCVVCGQKGAGGDGTCVNCRGGSRAAGGNCYSSAGPAPMVMG